MSEPQFTSRYEALGIPLPDPATICQGHCEGTGVFPVYMSKGDTRPKTPTSTLGEDETDPDLIALWEDAEEREPQSDGWHFVQCPDCNGTGKRSRLDQVKGEKKSDV